MHWRRDREIRREVSFGRKKRTLITIRLAKGGKEDLSAETCSVGERVVADVERGEVSF